jgi:glycosyltransferase involved in cell wall biosynthesis
MVPPNQGGRKLRVLAVGLAWESATGGHTVTRELSIGMAEAGHDVRMWLPGPVREPGIPNLSVHYPTNPGERIDPAWSGSERLAAEHRMLLTGQGLPDDVDMVIGHARFTGDTALQLRDRYYPQAKAVYVMHMSPEEGSRARHGDGAHADRKAREDVARMKQADLVVGVGPLITEESQRLLQRERAQVPVHQMIPGIVAQDPPMYREQQLRYEILLTGRMDDLLKGGPEAVKMVTELRRRGIPAHLVVRGVPPDKLAAEQLRMNEVSGNSVRLRPFTNDPDELRRDLNGADVFVMPSHHEGFGLVATEAAGAGVPILTDELNTGVGMFLADADRVPPELGRGSVVRASSHDTQAWADRIQWSLENLPAERSRALQLREHLTTNFSWRHAGEHLVQAVNQVERNTPSLSPDLQTAVRAGLNPATTKAATTATTQPATRPTTGRQPGLTPDGPLGR